MCRGVHYHVTLRVMLEIVSKVKPCNEELNASVKRLQIPEKCHTKRSSVNMQKQGEARNGTTCNVIHWRRMCYDKFVKSPKRFQYNDAGCDIKNQEKQHLISHIHRTRISLRFHMNIFLNIPENSMKPWLQWLVA